MTKTVARPVPHSLVYNPALDGIRGLAVTAIVCFHFGLCLTDGPSFGVDLFFVLSGFLITSVLVKSYPAVDLRLFYFNRFARLVPALWCLLAGYGLFGVALLDPRQTIADLLSTASYVANWTRAFATGTPQYLGHAWSLAIEEQFYLLYPPVLLLLLRIVRPALVGWWLLGLAAASLALRLLLSLHGADFARLYNGSDTRCDGLLLGCALAMAGTSGRAPGRLAAFAARTDFLALAGLFGLFCFGGWSLLQSAMIDVVSVWLVHGACHPTLSRTARIISIPPLVWLGRISYGLYLWHYPIALYLSYKLQLPVLQKITIGIPLSLLVSSASYRFIEAPVLRRRGALAPELRRRLGAANLLFVVTGMAACMLYFFHSDLAQLLHPVPFEIADYGPRIAVQGEAFNRQPDGRSMLWISTNERPPRDLAVTWNGKPLERYVTASAIDVVIGPELLNELGTQHIRITADGPHPIDRTLDLQIVPRH